MRCQDRNIVLNIPYPIYTTSQTVRFLKGVIANPDSWAAAEDKVDMSAAQQL